MQGHMREKFDWGKKENGDELEEIRRNYCSCELERKCPTCEMFEEIKEKIDEK